MLKTFNINLDEKVKVIITTVAIISVTLLICSGIIKYHIKKSRDVRLKIAEESEKLVLRNDIVEIEGRYNEYAEYFYETIDQESLRLIISGLARESGVDILSVKPFGYKKIANISKDMLKISLRCTYSQLVDVIAKIERLPQIMKVEELSLAGVSDFKAYISGDDDRKKELMESDTKTTASLVVAAYSIKD